MDSSEASAEAITYATSQLQLNNGSREKTPQHQQPARPLHRRLDEEPTSAELVDEMRSEASSHGSQRSKSKSSQTTSTTNAGDSARQSTKVYYHIDDEQTPYCTEVHVPADRITLGDFKRVLNRSNFKYYCKAIDQQVGGEVKAEIRDDNQLLHKSSNGQFELFLLTAEGSSHSDGTSSAFSKPAVRHNMVPGQPLLRCMPCRMPITIKESTTTITNLASNLLLRHCFQALLCCSTLKAPPPALKSGYKGCFSRAHPKNSHPQLVEAATQSSPHGSEVQPRYGLKRFRCLDSLLSTGQGARSSGSSSGIEADSKDISNYSPSDGHLTSGSTYGGDSTISFSGLMVSSPSSTPSSFSVGRVESRMRLRRWKDLRKQKVGTGNREVNLARRLNVAAGVGIRVEGSKYSSIGYYNRIVGF